MAEYHSNIGPRTASRASASRQSGHWEHAGVPGAGGSGRSLKIVSEMGTTSVPLTNMITKTVTTSFKEATEKEKKDMQGLNDRLGNYIDRVKGLEQQNRKLVGDLEELKGNWGKDTLEIKEKFSRSLTEARRDIDEGARKRADVDVKTARLQDDINEYRKLLDDINQVRLSDKDKIENYVTMIADANAEIEMLRQRFKSLNDEHNRFTDDNQRLWGDLRKAREALDEEALARIDYQNQAQTLMEELEFLRRIHDQEVKELQSLISREPADTREFFKNELALAIRDIRDEYDLIAQQNRTDMESWYKMKVSEVQAANNRMNMEGNYQRDEVKRLRDNIGDLRGKLGDLEGKNATLEKTYQELNYQHEDDQRQYESAINDRDAQIRKMRDECQGLVAELQALLETKQMLDSEIAIYRKMLEGEESRAGLRQMVEQVVKSHSLQQQDETETQRNVKGELSTRTTFQRSAKGNISISECEMNGKSITLENTHRTKEENISEWKLSRKLDGQREILYTLPQNTVLKPGSSLKIWARDQGGKHNPPHELVFSGETSWGMGQYVFTSLSNTEGEERATHTQRTVVRGN